MSIRPALAAAAAVLVLAAPAAAQSPEPKTNLSDIEDEVICLVCGTTLELTDNAPQAEQLRDQIRDLVDQGLTKDQVKDELVAEYGESVLATPDTEGFDLTAWILPGLAMFVAAGAIGVFVLRNRRDQEGSDEATLSAADAERLRRDMSRYDS